MSKLSIVIPAYNESKNIPIMIEALKHAFENRNDVILELIFVDDGSTDNTWEVLKESAKQHHEVNAVQFSRNFGKESAIFAGLDQARGDACIVMDCDMQHPPEVAAQLYEVWKNNPDIDIVEAKKRSRGNESKINKLFAKLFYGFFKSMSGIDMKNSSDFKLMNRKVLDALASLPERYTFFRALSNWIGFTTTEIYFDVTPRFDGDTKWSFKKLFRYAIHSISSFSSVPMQIVTVCGVIFLIFAIILGIQTLVNFFLGHALGGFTTVILAILFTGGIIMLSLGIIGFYIAKIYDEIKQRPRYIISKKIGQ